MSVKIHIDSIEFSSFSVENIARYSFKMINDVGGKRIAREITITLMNVFSEMEELIQPSVILKGIAILRKNTFGVFSDEYRFI